MITRGEGSVTLAAAHGGSVAGGGSVTATHGGAFAAEAGAGVRARGRESARWVPIRTGSARVRQWSEPVPIRESLGTPGA